MARTTRDGEPDHESRLSQGIGVRTRREQPGYPPPPSTVSVSGMGVFDPFGCDRAEARLRRQWRAARCKKGRSGGTGRPTRTDPGTHQQPKNDIGTVFRCTGAGKLLHRDRQVQRRKNAAEDGQCVPMPPNGRSNQ